MNTFDRVRGAIVVMLLLAATGCGSGYDVTPSTVSARAALERALTAWKGGAKPGTIASSEPPIQVVDSTWLAGRKLQSFEIVKEDESQAERRFVVSLDFPRPAGKQEAQYIVIGKNPVWIYREEDYRRMLDMDNNPRPVPASPRRGR